MTAWKAHERAIAKRLGGRRTGPLGKQSVDVEHPTWAIECKERKTLPAWLEEALAQAERAARPEQTAVAIIHRLGTRHDRDLVVMRLRAFEDLSGRVDEEERETT